MPLSKEQLMQERYEPIFVKGKHYPKSIYKEGEIITVGRSGDFIFCDTDGPRMSEYPNLFRRLEWWEKRKVEDMPEYLKVKETGMVGKVSKWDKNLEGATVGKYWWGIQFGAVEPASEQEYLDYLNSKK